jgi:small subunit ribosomal protein S13
MVYFMQTNLKPNFRLRRALSNIYGISTFRANRLCDQMGFRLNMQVKHLKSSDVDQMTRMIGYSFATGSELRRTFSDVISRFKRIGCYKGFRFTQGLPMRGQRTHSNAKNARRNKQV